MSKPWLAKHVSWLGSEPCHGRWLHSICVFGVRDLPRLIKRKEFMLNKFSTSVQPLAAECIGQWIEYRTQCQPTFDTSYYQQLPFIYH